MLPNVTQRPTQIECRLLTEMKAETLKDRTKRNQLLPLAIIWLDSSGGGTGKGGGDVPAHCHAGNRKIKECLLHATAPAL